MYSTVYTLKTNFFFLLIPMQIESVIYCRYCVSADTCFLYFHVNNDHSPMLRHIYAHHRVVYIGEALTCRRRCRVHVGLGGKELELCGRGAAGSGGQRGKRVEGSGAGGPQSPAWASADFLHHHPRPVFLDHVHDCSPCSPKITHTIPLCRI